MQFLVIDKMIFLNKTVEIALYAKITDGFNLVMISQIMVFGYTLHVQRYFKTIGNYIIRKRGPFP